MRISAAIILLLVAVYAAPARAQFYPYGGYGGYGRASTPGESYLRGSADLVRSAGAYNLQNSVAAQNYAQARSMEMDNRLKYAETYYERKRLHEEAQANKNRRLSSEALFRINQAKKPDRLSSTDLDPLSGKINWPVVFQQDQFAEARDGLEAIFAKQARQDHVSYDDYRQVQALGAQMREELSTLIKEMRPDDYINAKNFLESLMHEARLATT
jgi:hypothetical protein